MDSHKRSTQLERLEMVETGRRRRRWSDDEKLRIAAESFKAPRAKSSTARRHGISRSLLMTWRRSFGPEPISRQEEQAGFARVVIAADVEPAGTPTSGQMVIVGGKDRRVIVDADVEASRAIRQAEVGASRTMIDRTARRFGITPRHLAADSAYGSAANLAWLVKERQIEPHIPVFDKSNRTDGTFSRSDFVFDAERNHYTCPQGKLLVQFRRTYATPRSGITKDGTRLYRSSKSDCQSCAFKAKCCPNTPQRKVPRDLDEDARDVARTLANTPAYERSRHR